MQISNEPPSGPRDRASQARAVFVGLYGVIDAALTDEYAIPELEAAELEKDLYLSFVKFWQPPARISIRDQGPDLLTTACRGARDYQRHRLQTLSLLPDERLARVLAREPSEVARERFARALETFQEASPDV